MRARRPPTTAGAEPELLSPGLVHELRQPLTGLDAGLKLVARELGEPVTRLDGWKIAIDQLRRLEETLETYQRLMTPGGAGAPGPFPVDAVVRRAIAGQRHRLEALHDRFALVIEQGVPHAHGAPQALHHAVTNLVANAVDALEGRPDGRIEVRVRAAAGAAGRAEVRVADSGVGIPPPLRRRLFTRRFTTKPPGAGSGLGLAIARRMMRASGGEVRLAEDDDPGRRPWSRTELVVDLAAGPDAPAPHAPDPPRRAAARAVPVVLATGVAVVLVAGVLAGWAALQRWMRGEAGAVPAVVAALDDVVEVAGAVGAVERLRAGAWEPVGTGVRLREDDTLRTAPGANATIAIGDRSRLVVSESTQLTVREMTAAVHRLRLSRGRISVDHQPDGARVVVVESEHGETVARAAAGRFSVLASGSAVAVATERGVVRLQAAGRAVDVAGGEQAVSFRGAAPEHAARIPVALLLEVARSAGLGDGTCGVEGRAEPGAEVRVEGRVVDPGPDGRFTARIPVPKGARTVRLVTRDAAGRVRERRVPCARPADPAVVSDFAVRWGQE